MGVPSISTFTACKGSKENLGKQLRRQQKPKTATAAAKLQQQNPKAVATAAAATTRAPRTAAAAAAAANLSDYRDGGEEDKDGKQQGADGVSDRIFWLVPIHKASSILHPNINAKP